MQGSILTIIAPKAAKAGVEFRMQRIITTYVFVVLMLSLGFFGVGTLASAEQFGTPAEAAVSAPDASQDPVRDR